ncbi:MAG TPA: FGGY family carbohydrate kinase [Anaerolineales bacterium]|nr:FGGY family carbohydrate kinase [Anaerolineales bacterium]
MDTILAFDLGTTALKCALHDLRGNVLAKASVEYELITPDPDSVEVDVETYWEAFKSALGSVVKESAADPASIKALGVSAQGETLILADKSGRPLRRAIVWLDNRAQQEAAELGEKFGHRHAYEITGQVKLVPTWPASKILWVRNHEPKTYEQVDKFLLIEDYFLHRLTGEYACEGSLVTSTCYWNFRTRQWWPEMLDALGVRAGQLPPYCESGEVVGTLRSDVAAELGLSPATRVCTGALDQACGAIGVGNIKPGVFSENTGAALAICASVEHATLDPADQMPCHYHGLPGLYMLHTFTSGGIVLRWFRDEFAQLEMSVGKFSGMDAYDLLGREAEKVPAGCEGLVMLPHLQGAMAPEANPDARGVFYGFTLRHGRNHFTRAIMESVCFIVRRNIEVIEGMGVPVREIRALGGGARSRVWKQIEADITGRPVLTTSNEEAATLGAAILAGKAVGLYSSVEEAVGQMVQIKDRFEPTAANASIYDAAFRTYVDLYNALCPLFSKEREG